MGASACPPSWGRSFWKTSAGTVIMKHRDVEFTVVQGLGRQVWRWTFAVYGNAVSGQSATKPDAIQNAERAIDRALAQKKLRLILPDRD